jgi:hypothetical protein
MAYLLKRSDAPLYRVFIGGDCAGFVQRLTHEHCFEILLVLHAPSIIPDARERLDVSIHDIGTHRGNAWFQASLEQALKVFLTVLPAETAEPLLAELAACSAMYPADDVETPVHADPPVEDSDMETEPDDPIWDYVQTCSTREATRCVEIRAALEEKVGKTQAQKLLARTKPTVAQDSSGKKNRVLKLGGSLLKLK